MSNQKAFPITNSVDYNNGMDLRDYFAAAAMQSLVWSRDQNIDTHEDVAEVAYLYADAMMKAREQ